MNISEIASFFLLLLVYLLQTKIKLKMRISQDTRKTTFVREYIICIVSKTSDAIKERSSADLYVHPPASCRSIETFLQKKEKI